MPDSAKNPASRSAQLISGVVWAFALMLIAGAYALGIGATFLFDDIANLDGLAALQAHGASPYDLIRFSFAGIASEMGRPLAMLTFAVQAGSWPNFPWDFLRINVLIHLINAALLALWLRKLLRLSGCADDVSTRRALFISALWAAAPIHIGAVLYAIQRMALLSGTFMFGGILLYLSGRERLVDGRHASAIIRMGTAALVGVGGGVLCKENAVLLPLLLMVLEATVLPRPANRRIWHLSCGLFLVVPTAALCAYLASHMAGYLDGYAYRSFDLSERLMTETRVLFTYLHKVLMPPLYGMRMYYDDYPMSHSLLSPPGTVLAIAGWVVLLTASIVWRRRFAFPAMAVLWFLAAHFLESTFIPLEIAFDHRNYVASVGPLAAAVVVSLDWIRSRPSSALRTFGLACLAIYTTYFLVACAQSSMLRGSPLEQVMYWAKTQPNSKRAQMEYAVFAGSYGKTSAAEETFRQMQAKWPDNPAIPTTWYEMGCWIPSAKTPPVETVIAALGRPWPDVETAASIYRMAGRVQEGKCEAHPPEELERIAVAALAAPGSVRWRRNLHLAYAVIAWANNKPDIANRELEVAIRMTPDISSIQTRVYWAAGAGDVATARTYIAMAENDPRIPQAQRWANRREIAGMRRLVDIVEQIQLRQASEKTPG